MDNRIRDFLDAIADTWVTKAAALVFVVLLVITAAIAISQNIYISLSKELPRSIASIDAWKMGMVVGSAGTATAFLATLYVAQRNYRRRREHIPHLTMSLNVDRVVVSQTYDTVIASLDATNTGSGLCEVNRVHWMVLVASPYDDDTIDEILKEFGAATQPGRETAFPWRRLEERITHLKMLVEPGETEQMTQDFVIRSEVSAVIVSAWVANASTSAGTEGWYRRVLHIPQGDGDYAGQEEGRRR